MAPHSPRWWPTRPSQITGDVLLHLSRLAPYRAPAGAPAAALLIAERDDGRDDVQTLARITLVGDARPIDPASPDYAAARHLPGTPASPPKRCCSACPTSCCSAWFPARGPLSAALPLKQRPYTLTPTHLRQAAGLD
ncbi:MAG: hypothetical protein U0Z44_02890 [Kouleothrix sp.]